MPSRWLTALMLLLGLQSTSAAARLLEVEVDFQHVGGTLEPAELEALLADPNLVIEAVYHPVKLIEGKTATRSRTMPIGSRLYAIPRQVDLKGPQIERAARGLRFRIDERAPEHDDYRLISLTLRVPLAAGLGRPQPALEIGLLNGSVIEGARQAGMLWRAGTLDLGMRRRTRWSDAQGGFTREPPMCNGDVQEIDADRYRFRPRHRSAGFFEFLGPTVHSDPPQRPPPNQTSLQMRAPYPEPIAGWRLSRNHLVRLRLGDGEIDRLSVYAEQPGAGECRRTWMVDALFAGNALVSLERSIHSYGCSADASAANGTLRLDWLEDGSLARYLASSSAGSRLWDAFAATQAKACGTQAPAPDASEVRALEDEIRRLRAAFLAL